MKKHMYIFNTTKHYGIIAILFHWFFALLVIGLFASGFYMVELTYYDPWYQPLPQWHIFFGILCLFLLVLRSAWHFFTTQPQLETDSKIEKKLAPIAHKLLLILSLVVLISGYMITSVDNEFIEWLGIHLPAFNLDIDQQASLAGLWHEYIAYGLIALVVLHALAALKHAFWDKKPIFKKILWPVSSRPSEKA